MSTEPAGCAAASSGVITDIFGFEAKRSRKAARTFGAASTSVRCWHAAATSAAEVASPQP